MKQAFIKYICNGYSVQLMGDPVDPTPVYGFAANLTEVGQILGFYFENIPITPAGVFVFTPSDRALKAVDPLMNQETQVWPAEPIGYITRATGTSANPSVPGSTARPTLEEYCPDLAAVSATLAVVYTPPVP